LKHHQKPYRSHIQKSSTQGCSSQIAWRGTRTAKRYQLLDRLAGDTYRQAHSAFDAHCLQVSPGGMPLATKRLTPLMPLLLSLSRGRTCLAAKRLVFQSASV